MTNRPTIGLPRLHHEKNERRDFLPSLVGFLDQLGVAEIVLEAGYGSGMGVLPDEYLAQSRRARFGSASESMAQDVVALLRCPQSERLRQTKPGAVLVSMLHFDTRPSRVAHLRELELQAVSIDLVRDDLGRRLVENLEAVAMNGMREAFRQLREKLPGFADPTRGPLRVSILGAGAVGALAARAAARYGDDALRAELTKLRVTGVEVTLVDFELAGDAAWLATRLPITDLLVDATRRVDATQVVVPNAAIATLPSHAVVLDLTADAYDFATTPPRVKAIEGVPHGDLDQFLFQPDDPAFDALCARVAASARRTTLCCCAWPGIDAKACMQVYSKQLEPVLRAVVEIGVQALDVQHGTWAERAVARATLSRWEPRP